MFAISNPTSPTDTADWAEWYVVHRRDTLSKSTLGNAMSNALGSDVADEAIDSVWLELKRRQALYGPNSPIKVSGRLLETIVDWKANPAYMACLIFSVTGNVDTPGKSGKLFEELSSVAFKNYIGGDSIACGAPLKLTVKQLSDYVNETFVKEFPAFRKDRNLDVMAWRSFNDNRPNQLIVLIQCASGKNWRNKTTELVLRAWESYINFLVPPVRGFTLPDIISDMERFQDYGYNAGIILDRVRIYRCIDGVMIDASLQSRLIKWCDDRIKKMNKLS